MQGQRQGVCSTKEAESPDKNQTIIPHVKKHDILILVYNAKATIYSDQTEMFPVVLSKGNKYVMVLHDADSNLLWAEPMKNQTGGELILARNRALTRIGGQGNNPKHQILDNQASESYAIRALGMTYQLVLQMTTGATWPKKPFKPSKIISLEYSAGALQPCPSIFGANSYLKLSGNYSYSNNHDYIQTYQHTCMSMNNTTTTNTHSSPLAWMVHDKPHKHQTFAEHCSKAFVLGTSTEHYRCWKFWTVSMPATRVSGTAFFKHKYLTNPSVTPEDQIIAAAARLTDAIQGTIITNMRTSTLKSLSNLQSIFHDAAKGYDTHQSKAEVPIMRAVQHHAPVSPQTPDNNTPMKSLCAPSRVHPNITPNIARNLFGREPPTEQMLPNSPKGGIQSPLHVRHNALPNPNSPDKQPQPRWLQQMAKLGILTKPAPIDAPANNTHI
jgi:hypothetical protein